MAVKKKEYENLTSTNVLRVIGLLEPKDGKAITKKEACSILNIAYNTTRLGRIISETKERQKYIEKQKAKRRGKAASSSEISTTITEYLTGETISDISKGLFRSPGFCKAIIERVGVPSRPTTAVGRAAIDYIPDECVSETFSKDEIVWSAKYHRTAFIKKEMPGYEKKYGSKCYAISVIEPVHPADSFFPNVTAGGFDAYVLAYDLGRLKHLEQYGVDLAKI